MPSKKILSHELGWFSLKQYEAFRALSQADFILQVAVRVNHLAWLKADPKPPSIRTIEQIYTSFAKLSRVNPVVDLTRFRVGNKVHAITSEARAKKRLGVSRMTVGQFQDIDTYMPSAVKEKIEDTLVDAQMISLGFGVAGEKRKAIQKFYGTAVNDCGQFEYDFFCVDFRATNEVLLREFKRHLTDRRKAYKRVLRPIGKVDVSQWVKFQLIPYLDLQIFALEQGKTISHAMLGNRLFENHDNWADLPRKSVEPIVMALLERLQIDPDMKLRISAPKAFLAEK